MHGGRAVRGLASLRGGIRAVTERCVLVEERPGDHGACVQGRMPVMRQRILQSTDRPRASGSGQVIMGRAAGPGCPVRPGANEGVARGVLGDHGACAQAGMPVTWQRILQLTAGRALVEERPGDHRACTWGPEPVTQQGIARIGGGPCAGGGRPGDHGVCGRPGRSARPGSRGRVGGRRQVIMGRALGARYPLRSNGFPNRQRRVRWWRAAR